MHILENLNPGKLQGFQKIFDKSKKHQAEDPLFYQSMNRLRDLLNVSQCLVQYTNPASQFGSSFKEDLIFEIAKPTQRSYK